MRRRSPLRRWGRTMAALAVLLGLVTAFAPGSAGATQEVALRLVRQALDVPAGSPMSFELTPVGSVPADAQLTLTVGARLDEPSAALEQWFGTGVLPSDVLAFQRLAVADLPRGDAGQLLVDVPTGTDRNDYRRGLVWLSEPGLYPVRLELRTADDEVIATLDTAVHRPPDGGEAQQSSVALVLPVTSPPATQPDGTVAVDPAAREALDTLRDVFARHPELALTVGYPPELLEQLGASDDPGDATLLAGLRDPLGSRELLSTPYVSMDPTTAARGNLGDEFARQLARGEEVLASSLAGSVPDRRAWVAPTGIGAEGLGLLRTLGAQVLVTPAAAVTGAAGEPVTTASDRVVRIESPGTPGLNGAVVEPSLQAGFLPSDDPVLAAYRQTARLLAAHRSAPDTGRGMVVLPPRGWVPDRAFLGTLTDLLATSPSLEPVTLEGWVKRVEMDAGAPPLAPAPVLTDDRRALADEVGRVRASIAALTSVVPDEPTLAAALEQATRLAMADDVDDATRAAYLSSVQASLDGIRAAVLPVELDRFTITSRRARLPITLETTSPRPLQVKLRLTSPKLTFPEGDQVVTIDGKTTVDIPVEARANGTFRVGVEVMTPNGDVPLVPPQQLTVTASATSGLGLAITIAAAAMLGLWWIHHARKARAVRREAREATADRHPTSFPPPTAPTLQ